MTRWTVLLLAVAGVWASDTVWIGATQQPAGAPASPEKPETGISIHDKTVLTACGPCHKADEKQQLSRISFQRNTPEGWQDTIRRMAALNGLKIEPEAARQVVKYLSNNLGLAPDEVKPGAFEVERRLVDYKYAASPDAEGVCTKCHSMGRVILQRRTRSEWDLLIAMHRGWYPLVDFQAFRRTGPPPREPGPDGRPPDTRHPVEKAIEHLSKVFPLQTAEWTAWSATMRPARLEGTWALSGWDPGKGAVYGRAQIRPVANTSDEFTTDLTFTYGRTGETVSRTGRSVVYTGFQWRGRSTVGADDKTSLREVMLIDRDWRRMEGRWFTGGYDELGLDVRLDRVAGETIVFGTDVQALRAGAAGQQVKIYGLNLPASVQAGQVDLGPGVTVARVVSAAPEALTVAVDVAAAAAPGSRDLFVAGAARSAALAIYRRIDRIEVTPEWSMARVGGPIFPKMLSQFEAWAFDNGADGKPDTSDDVKLGLVPATWSLEEYTATYEDDDVKYVGALDARTGLFTPALDGPNTERSGSRNNIGDVWVVASYTPEASDGKPASALRARAHLLVTVPLYMRWDPTAAVTR
jgi:quinohemoprotein amine dehydrogenase